MTALDVIALFAFLMTALAIAGAAGDWYDKREARRQHIRDRMATYCSRQP